ncbi:MAG: hypothetical protein J3K34DRAFT_516967 [Monoraphidium minutum]|nr:MAG: hypothetical protein J3K34DRAFT_516967 [Monoraphidium minutum]
MVKKDKGAAQAAAKPEKKEKAAAAAKAPEQPAPAAADKGKGKRAKDEIDDIFSSKPAKKAAAAAADEEGGSGGGAAQAPAAADGGEDTAALSELAEQVKAAREKAKRPKVEGSKDDIFGVAGGKSRKRTEEGFAIYSEEELGFSKRNAGETDLCPFDCDCCY